jgi:hypothetical protein
MIVLWPLITSKTINPIILQGVCKSLEKYVFIHRLDDVLEAANENIRKNNKKRKTYLKLQKMFGRQVLKLEDIDYDVVGSYLSEDSSTRVGGKGGKGGKNKGGKDKKNIGDNTPRENDSKPPKPPMKAPGAPGGGSSFPRPSFDPPEHQKPQEVKIGKMDHNILSNEPTWQQVQDQEGNTTIIGVKVVPYIIENDQSLIKMMLSDKALKGMDRVIEMQSRKLLRIMYKIANFSWKKTAGLFLSWTGLVSKSLVKGTVTQDWKNDIYLQNTTHGPNMFIMLNKLDLEDNFTTNADGIRKLFGMGWTSFIVADDINKSVSFCMNTYKGMCSVLNYSFLYADGKSGAQVYKDIEDVRKSAGPLFRLNRRKKAMITDDLAQYKINQYSQTTLINESYLTEGLFPDILKQITNNPKKLVNNLKGISSAVKRQDFKTAYKISKRIDPGNKKNQIHQVVDRELKTNSKFKINYELSYKVLDNSIDGLPPDLLKVGSALVASLALINRDKNYNIKNDLKKIVMKTRAKAGEKTQYEKDVKTAFIFAIITVVFTSSISIWLIYIILSWTTIAATTITSNIIPLIAITGMIYLIRFLAAKEENKVIEANKDA